MLKLIESFGEQAVIAWTDKCVKDMQKFGLDGQDFCDLAEIALRAGNFRGSEWCVQNPNGPWAACDAYSMVRREWVPNAHKDMNFEYYIKFAIAKTGKVLLVVSCHPTEERT